MSAFGLHTFHIPVMGLGYTIDTPVKVGRFGISSVISIIEDELLEQMRSFYCKKEGVHYEPIDKDDIDHRAKRITAYLNLIHAILNRQILKLKNEKFENGTELTKYFELLPEGCEAKRLYLLMKETKGAGKEELKAMLYSKIASGSIDVNIMTKLDKTNYDKAGNELPVEYCDAMAALRGYALSDLNSSVIFSAGLNPRLYSYCESFNDFFPDESGQIKKKIILKVSDFRSAMIQGKFLAKKGLWVSEFRLESGLNCGGHAFVTEGYLAGPILQEFKDKKQELERELHEICNASLEKKKLKQLPEKPELKITYQGGIGTWAENSFLLNYYSLSASGWGSPFLLVPEATNVDDSTLHQLANSDQEDYYLSNASPLGIPFNNFRKSSAEIQRKTRIKKGRPGSPCYKKFLISNKEFTLQPICTASREYQNLKIEQTREKNIPSPEIENEIESIEERDCLCEGLGSSVLLKNHITPHHKLKAVTICPGPNLAFFNGIYSLEEMVNHIYGRINILNSKTRPHIFINELALYVAYIKKEIQNQREAFSVNKIRYFNSFKENLLKGINYYRSLVPELRKFGEVQLNQFEDNLQIFESEILKLIVPQKIF